MYHSDRTVSRRQVILIGKRKEKKIIAGIENYLFVT
jgi:hypothetical protein